jgi:signal transduction histidine kinase
MSAQASQVGIALLCDAQSAIRRVLRDDLGVTSARRIGEPFISLVPVDSRAKAFAFLTQLRSKGGAFGWELTVNAADGPTSLYFVGAAMDDDLLIIGARSPVEMEQLCDQVTEISTEQAGSIRALLKESLRDRPADARIHQDRFDDLTGLYNELATMQRALAKRNLDLENEVRERRRATEALKEFIALVSHDLRSPLTAILGTAELLRRSLVEQSLSRDARFAETIATSARRMDSMIRELVDSARLEAGGFEMNRVPTNLRELIAEIVQRVGTTEDQARLQIESPPALPLVAADVDRLERAIVNLVTNALKYSPPTSPVVIRLEHGKAEVVIAVIDQGVGIPLEEQPRVFDRHYRAKGVGSVAGLGLGLYIARLIVAAHNGRIWVESSVGKGSVFRIALPLPEGGEPARPERKSEL